MNTAQLLDWWQDTPEWGRLGRNLVSSVDPANAINILKSTIEYVSSRPFDHEAAQQDALDILNQAIEDLFEGDEDSIAIRCNQCVALMIQGVFCHETGCPNTNSRFDAETGEWIKQRKCFECGCTVDADDLCCNAELEDDEEHEDADSLEDRGLTLGSYAS
jgi:hypothetical protein